MAIPATPGMPYNSCTYYLKSCIGVTASAKHLYCSHCCYHQGLRSGCTLFPSTGQQQCYFQNCSWESDNNFSPCLAAAHECNKDTFECLSWVAICVVHRYSATKSVSHVSNFLNFKLKLWSPITANTPTPSSHWLITTSRTYLPTNYSSLCQAYQEDPRSWLYRTFWLGPH